MSSISGFVKKELYEELEKLLSICDGTHKDPQIWEKAIKIICELLCTHGQVLGLLSFFINFSCKYMHIYNIHVWNMMSHSVKSTVYTYERDANNPDIHCYCHYIGRIFIICCISPKKHHSDFFKKVAYLEYIQPQIESLLYETWIQSTFYRYVQMYATELTQVARSKMCVFLFALERKNKTLVFSILYDLLSPRSCYIQLSSELDASKDMLWYVWGTFIKYVTAKTKDKLWVKWLRDMYGLSKFQFGKDKRTQRMQLLLFSLRLFLNGSTKDEENYISRINYAIPSIEKDMKTMVNEIKQNLVRKKKSTKPRSSHVRQKTRQQKQNVNSPDEDDELPDYLNFIPLKMAPE